MTEKEDFIGYFLEIIRRSHLDPDARLAYEGLKEEIARIREREKLLENHALVDVLTNLGNRRALDERKVDLELEMRSDRRRASDPPLYGIVVASADLIGLKHFNQKYSQTVGDDAIRIIASSLSSPFRKGEWFRRGGDEFVGLMAVADKEHVEEVIENIKYGSPKEYGRLRKQRLDLPLPKEFPVLCATQVYSVEGIFRSLNEAELAADPKTRGRDRIISFESNL